MKNRYEVKPEMELDIPVAAS
jgi:hypothetical protein